MDSDAGTTVSIGGIAKRAIREATKSKVALIAVNQKLKLL